MATTVIAATYGILPEFDPDNETVESYTARAKVFFTANSIPEDKQAAIFLSCVGAKTYDLLVTLIAPDTLDTATLDSLFTALREHFQPTPNIISKRYAFHRRNQLPSENIAEYAAALRKLATDCNFGTKDTLEETLRDHLVGGVRNAATQKKLLSMKNLTFAEACDVARSLEAAEANSKEISSALSKETNATGAAATVQFMARRQSGFRPPSKELRPFSSGSQQQQQPCYRCGRRNHTPKDCKFAEATCHACGRQGHIAPACRSRSVSKKPGGPPTPRRRSKIHKVKA